MVYLKGFSEFHRFFLLSSLALAQQVEVKCTQNAQNAPLRRCALLRRRESRDFRLETPRCRTKPVEIHGDPRARLQRGEKRFCWKTGGCEKGGETVQKAGFLKSARSF